MRVAEQRFLSVVLAPKVDTSKPTAGTPGATQASPPPTNDWSDALAILRGLARGASPPGPRIAGSDSSSHGHSGKASKPGKAGKPGKADPLAKPDDGKSDSNFLTSPWFWGGLGVVLSVGVTVLVLSQTALNEPDVVVLEGHVSP